MALNKALAVFICSMLLLSAILLVEPVKAGSPQSSNLEPFTLYGWIWSPDYAQYGIGNITLTLNGTITYDPDIPQTWNFHFPNSQLNITIQPGATQTYTINLAGSKTRSVMQLGELDYPTRSTFSGVWLDNNYTWIEGHIYLAPVPGGVFNSTSPYYFVMRTRNVDIPLSTSGTGVAGGVDSIINNVFRVVEQVNSQMYQYRSGLSDILAKLVVIFDGIRGLISPYVP